MQSEEDMHAGTKGPGSRRSVRAGLTEAASLSLLPEPCMHQDGLSQVPGICYALCPSPQAPDWSQAKRWLQRDMEYGKWPRPSLGVRTSGSGPDHQL